MPAGAQQVDVPIVTMRADDARSVERVLLGAMVDAEQAGDDDAATGYGKVAAFMALRIALAEHPANSRS